MKLCQLPHELYLSDYFDAIIFALADILNELDGDLLFGGLAFTLDDLAIASLANYFLKFIVSVRYSPCTREIKLLNFFSV